MATGLIRRAIYRVQSSSPAARLLVARAHASDTKSQQVQPQVVSNLPMESR
uniref:Uncharacterized protein n=1 Tax=Solanum lycopersicum TaxID=4081 RepID=A0A3Q7FDA1_SOLLC